MYLSETSGNNPKESVVEIIVAITIHDIINISTTIMSQIANPLLEILLLVWLYFPSI